MSGTRALTLVERLAEFEKARIAAAIVAHRGRLSETYEALGLSRKMHCDKRREHGLSPRDNPGGPEG